MPEMITAKEPFRFCTRLHLSELTGLRAANLVQLIDLIKQASDSCIYHHTHRFLQQHQYLSPEPPNDFAYWVSKVLDEDELGERLSSIDTIQFSSINGIRDKIVETLEQYISAKPLAKMKFARAGEEFHFMKSISFILATSYIANDLRDFIRILDQITIDSIYFHIFEARLRLKRETNDFSHWIATSLGDKKLADDISKLDPYTYTLEELRKTVIKLAQERLNS